MIGFYMNRCRTPYSTQFLVTDKAVFQQLYNKVLVLPERNPN